MSLDLLLPQRQKDAETISMYEAFSWFGETGSCCGGEMSTDVV
jgi:hypothetical protein